MGCSFTSTHLGVFYSSLPSLSGSGQSNGYPVKLSPGFLCQVCQAVCEYQLTKSILLNTHCSQCFPATFMLREWEEGTAGWECSRCWTDPDISHRVEVCWMWERTLPFNPKALSRSHFLLCVPGKKRCMGLRSRQPEGPLRPALPAPAHSTHLSSTAITRRTQTSWWTVQSAQRPDPAALVSVASLLVPNMKALLQVLRTNSPIRYMGTIQRIKLEYSHCEVGVNFV